MKKKLNQDGLEVVDGRIVDVYETRFSGSQSHEPEDMSGIADGDLVAFVVVGRAKSPRFSDAKDPYNFKRINTFQLEGVIPLSVEKAQTVLSAIGESMLGVNEGMVEAVNPKPVSSRNHPSNPDWKPVPGLQPRDPVLDVAPSDSNVVMFDPIAGMQDVSHG